MSSAVSCRPVSSGVWSLSVLGGQAPNIKLEPRTSHTTNGWCVVCCVWSSVRCAVCCVPCAVCCVRCAVPCLGLERWLAEVQLCTRNVERTWNERGTNVQLGTTVAGVGPSCFERRAPSVEFRTSNVGWCLGALPFEFAPARGLGLRVAVRDGEQTKFTAQM